MHKSLLNKVSKWGQIFRRNELWEGVWVYECFWEIKEPSISAYCCLYRFHRWHIACLHRWLISKGKRSGGFDIAYLNCITLEMWFSRLCFFSLGLYLNSRKCSSRKYFRTICRMLHMPFTRSLLEKAEYFVAILKPNCIEKIHAKLFLTLIA